MQTSRFDEFVQLLTRLPLETWEAAVTAEPEWKWMQPLSQAWKFGHFAALFVTLGLNDYQTKGKADVNYWPKVVPQIPRQPDPANPLQLIDLLKPFYSKERLAQTKLERLERFVRSDLCHKIWTSSSAAIAADFKEIWQSLGRTMNQQPDKKTIAFAMKCLALALLMVGETEFDFGAIPAPVSSRIRRISDRLGLPPSDDATERQRWRTVLNQIRKSHPEITIVHLDSLVWQIGTLSPREMEAHLRELGAGNLATHISRLFSP